MGSWVGEKRPREAGASLGRSTHDLTLQPTNSLLLDYRPHPHDLEYARGHPLEGAETVVVPPRVRRPGDVPPAAVVGQDHPVLLHRAQDDLDLGGVRAHVVR